MIYYYVVMATASASACDDHHCYGCGDRADDFVVDGDYDCDGVVVVVDDDDDDDDGKIGQ